MPESKRRVVIVGASAAGLRCACRLARLDPEVAITVVEARDVFSYGACGLPYVLSGDIDNLQELRRTNYGVIRDAAFFADYKGIEVCTGWRATAIDIEGHVLEGETAEGTQRLEFDDLVFATGATPLKLPDQPDHDRVHSFHTWDDVKPLKMGLMQGEIDHVAVVGAGLVGCELAEAFHSLWGAEVSLIETAPTVLPQMVDPEAGALIGRHLEDSGVRLFTGTKVDAIEAGDDGAVVKIGDDTITCDAVVVAVGVAPNVAIAQAVGAEVGSSGALIVDERLATTVDHVWAAGDCVECTHVVTGEPTYLPLGSLANRQGRTLANVLAGFDDAFPLVTGATAVKVFDWNVAAVGCTAAQLQRSGVEFKSMWITGEATPAYWPESKEIFITLHYDARNLRVLGVQAAGAGDVAKRVDIASQLIAYGATLEDFAELEHAYAPPYAPAIDPLAVAAFVALNQEAGLIALSPQVSIEGRKVIDVRLPEERERRAIEIDGIIGVEMSEVRERIGDIGDGPVLVVCERGTRSAEVALWLKRSGIDACYLGGGMSWRGKSR